MAPRAYGYVGPEQIRIAAAGQPAGASIANAADLDAWLRANPAVLAEGATYVVDTGGTLRLAPRRSEHVACAGGESVLAAGEIQLTRTAAGRLAVSHLSNQSTGYCPDVACWEPLHAALVPLAIALPPTFTHPVIFRRCPSCHERNLVKDDWYECALCGSDLPRVWNFAD